MITTCVKNQTEFGRLAKKAATYTAGIGSVFRLCCSFKNEKPRQQDQQVTAKNNSVKGHVWEQTQHILTVTLDV